MSCNHLYWYLYAGMSRSERTYTSPGLFAVGPGRFSVSGVRTTRLMLHGQASAMYSTANAGISLTDGTLSFAIASAVAVTVAAPPAQVQIVSTLNTKRSRRPFNTPSCEPVA